MKFFPATLFFTFYYLFLDAQIAPQNSPYADVGPYTVLSDVDASANPDVYTFRPDVSNGETFPVFFFQLGANGFGSSAITASTYDIYLEHLASYGYVVILVNSSAAGFPNGSVYEDTYDWYLDKLADQNHWMSSTADPGRIVIGGHSLGGVQATAFLENNQSVIDGIVYFASYPSQGILGIGAHDIDNYAGNLLSIAGTEDGDSTPAECREGYDTYQGTACKYWVLIDGLGHAGFGNYETGGQVVGSIGRQDATATIRHYLVSFMEYTFKGDATAEQNLKQATSRPSTEEEFETTCPAILTSISKTKIETINLYPNPVSDALRFDVGSSASFIQVISVDGKLILESPITGIKRLDVSDLNSGIYALIVHDLNGNTTTSKFVKE